MVIVTTNVKSNIDKSCDSYSAITAAGYIVRAHNTRHICNRMSVDVAQLQLRIVYSSVINVEYNISHRYRYLLVGWRK